MANLTFYKDILERITWGNLSLCFVRVHNEFNVKVKYFLCESCHLFNSAAESYVL